jgi:hypothetical protein
MGKRKARSLELGQRKLRRFRNEKGKKEKNRVAEHEQLAVAAGGAAVVAAFQRFGEGMESSGVFPARCSLYLAAHFSVVACR